VLEEHRFTSHAVDALLGQNGRASLERGDLAHLDRLLSEGAPLAILVRLFVAGLATDMPAAARTLAPAAVDAFVDAGLVSVADDRVHPEAMLEEIDGLVLASDARRHSHRPDFVMRVSATTVALAGLTIRRPVQAALDIGCGSGYQALLAARHSDHVTAIDANPRAVAFARFNAALNGVGNVTFAEGDLFSDLPARQFDLIVSNPPFVISPGLDHQFRDSGRAGDAVCAQLARSIPAALAASGTGQFLVNWPVSRTGWRDHLTGWFKGDACNVWILHETTEPAAAYVAKWLDETVAQPGPGVPLYDEWTDWFDRHGIVAVGYGLVTVRPCDPGRGWVVIEDAPDDYTLPCGDEMAANLERRIRLDTANDATLLRKVWRRAPSVVLDDAPDGFEARLARGLCWRHPLDLDTAMVLAGCDGVRPLRDVIARVASDADASETSILPKLRPLMIHGLLCES